MTWATAGFDLFGQHVVWADLAGNLCALATVVLAIRRTIWTWPVQLTGAVLLFAASISAHITGNALKQVMFGALAVYGWWKWSRGMRERRTLAVRPGTTRERTALIGVMVAATFVVALVFHLVNENLFEISWNPLPDAYIFVGSAVATFAQGRALIDFWWIWVLVDVVGVPLAFGGGLVVSGIVYGVFLVLVAVGFITWMREYRAGTAAPVDKVVSA
ncbi:nicotinamide mononucleotide transporter family protein [Spongiactinospora sp. TRM90649]|uniref:nicotinamide mononucleotide transporter family protein n=1 Tax=Spongiactinospora sp. TRM90649 TaxID=3031114 RepID=UPI0023F94702|nr:nicotinamide mononucleotide transporter family protein [Spongiactinospora sp. TRM90649]MDF5756834.1 nicotinamide mononucleotide transporter family protein [Spongiactinospora sp. TRM90649]